ncbi:dioxygenase family protein [Defluviicoccus vanus]|uniref:Dioxygenase n=1 Tax=Defluviicoccus vanus TaxID=111831 RepID=A0A7H1N4R9_9PROT|nr:class III extradiol ring-cleavage dioxygenase [Defluviicoccus vanus]QNT70705.1 dioxygenase [Defluviicoccus vanus]
MPSLPALFVSHGSPMLALEDGPAHRFLRGYAARLPRPQAILVASAHWLSTVPMLSTAAEPATIHDFRGFSPALYAMRYPAPGAPALATAAQRLLAAAGIAATMVPDRGLDHGAWVPLSLLYPAADIPVTQLALQPDAGPAHHLRLGRALRPLREAGVLIIGSGSLTHNLSAAFANPGDAPAAAWVDAFAAWVAERLAAGAIDDLLAYRRRAPFAADNHPTEEHLLPLFVALGAGSDGGAIERLHASTTHAALAMDAYAFE